MGKNFRKQMVEMLYLSKIMINHVLFQHGEIIKNIGENVLQHRKVLYAHDGDTMIKASTESIVTFVQSKLIFCFT